MATASNTTKHGTPRVGRNLAGSAVRAAVEAACATMSTTEEGNVAFAVQQLADACNHAGDCVDTTVSVTLTPRERGFLHKLGGYELTDNRTMGGSTWTLGFARAPPAPPASAPTEDAGTVAASPTTWCGPFGMRVPGDVLVVPAADGVNVVHRDGGETELWSGSAVPHTRDSYMRKHGAWDAEAKVWVFDRARAAAA